ncbi:hypothetical protein EYZ11_008869 [Aspergillus tanneri]|uniref:Uncharacterized protein n=1 Tax=Aspergillus tanneri TaxID=1220188 RepID=A0A4V3UNL4_9EURO|nr:hypothetical protein EYZ11_008869 [Aspergillus tanneri]
MPDSEWPGAAAHSDDHRDTGYTPGNDVWTQWRNIFAMLSGKMSDEGKEQFRVARDVRNEVADCKRCEDQRDYLLQWSGLPIPSLLWIASDSMNFFQAQLFVF